MALITCPNCGEQISDKSKKCIHCGASLVPEEKIFCQECGTEIEPGSSVCPKCGCPVKVEKEDTQKVEVTGVKINKKSKKVLLIVVIAVVAVIIIAFAGSQIHKKNIADAAAQAAQEEASAYQEAFTTAYNDMITGAGDTEKCGTLVLSVWRNCIYEESDPETDKFTKPTGVFYSDFNDALQALYNDNDFSTTVSGIRSNQSIVASDMKKLQNPPEQFSDAYNAISSMYDTYVEFTNYVTDPSGTYSSYNSNFSDADTTMANKIKTMQVYFE